MANENYRLHIRNNSTILSSDRLSEEVKELPLDNAVQIASLQINMLIAHDDYHHGIEFGQAIPWPTGWKDEGKRLMIVGIFCLMFFVCNRLFLNIQPLDIKAYDMLSFMPFNNAYQDLIMEDEYSCFYMDKIVQKNPDIHSELILPNIYNERNIEDILKESSTKDMFDDLSCTVYDIFVYELFCSKENINTVVPTESQEDRYSNYDGSFVISKHSFVANENSGQTVPATERNHVIEQYVAVSTGEAGEINMFEKNAE